MSTPTAEHDHAEVTAVASAGPSPTATPPARSDLRIPGRETLFTATLLGIVGLAWVSLWVWGGSPYGRFLSHDEIEHAALTDLARLTPLFVGGWTLMTVAMMLPTSLPLVRLFHSITRARAHRTRLVGLLVAGYLIVWVAFGALAHLGDRGLHVLVGSVPWLDANPWVVGTAILALAGAYQFSRLKYRCLEQCRSPFGFIASHWRGRSDQADAFRLGLRHGLFCVGCCWTLMLLMFAVGAGNLAWMLVLGAVMAAEKNLRWARGISRPLGVALLASALASVMTQTALS